MSEGFSEAWLALREPYDAAARSADLADQLGRALPAEPRLLDLGAGSGSLLRWLAPLLAPHCPHQRWTLFDADRLLLEAALRRIAAWGEAARGVAEPGAASLALAMPWGRIEVALRPGDLSDPAALPLAGFDAVLCTALADLFSTAWTDALAAACRVPFYAALSVDGRVRWRPAHALDRRVEAAFRRDQRREKGLGHALGPDAPRALVRAFEARGARVLTYPSDWRIGPRAIRMLTAMVDGHADAARAQALSSAGAIRSWRADRLVQASRGRLSLDIGHLDLLALPGSETA